MPFVDGAGSSSDAGDGAGDEAAAPDDATAPVPPATACRASAPQCPSPPPTCAGPYVAVNYAYGQCDAGTCSWTASQVDCRMIDAGCVGSAGLDASSVMPGTDGAAWLNVDGCMLFAAPAPQSPT
jgi:hypothetical protein